jgi:hypothetical protein
MATSLASTAAKAVASAAGAAVRKTAARKAPLTLVRSFARVSCLRVLVYQREDWFVFVSLLGNVRVILPFDVASTQTPAASKRIIELCTSQSPPYVACA